MPVGSSGSETQNPGKLAYVGKTPASVSRDDWYTPEHVIASVRKALGGSIDLDPFSCAKANRTVKASSILTEEDDAFSCAWPQVSTVFMNPPYSKGNCAKAVKMFLERYAEGKFTMACVLTNNATETKWFQQLLTKSSAALFYGKRISFLSEDGKAVSNNTRGQVLFFFSNPHSLKLSHRFKASVKGQGTCLVTL